MKIFLIIVSIILACIWCLGVFWYGTGGPIHIVLVLAAIILGLGITTRPERD